MEHNICRDNLSAYLDGELTPQERLALETHLAGCPECRAELAGLKSVSGLVKAHAMEPVPPALKGAVLGKPRAARPWLKPVLAFSTAAAALLVVFNLTKTDENYSYSPGFGAREGGSVYSASTFQDRAMLHEEPVASVSAAAEEEAAPAAPAAGAGIFAENGGSARVSSVSSVRGSYAQAKFAAGGGAGGAKAKTAEKSAPEFRGPVCVYVSSPDSRREMSDGMEEVESDDYFWYLGKAMSFIERSGTPSPSSGPGRLVFIKNDGTRKVLTEKDCQTCYVLFDGVQDPLVVTEFIFFADQYNKYFGTSLPSAANNPD